MARPIGETAMRARDRQRTPAGSRLPPAEVSNRKLRTPTIRPDYVIIWIVAWDTWFMVVRTFAFAS